MGYTHYFSKPKTIQAATWKKLTADVSTVIANLPKKAIHTEYKWDAATSTSSRIEHKVKLALCGKEDQRGSKPIVDSKMIYFNGAGSKKFDLGHETFAIARVGGSGDFGNFCKTARKPYDLAVCAALILLAYHVPKATVSSDGDHKNWQPAYDLVKKLFPKYQFKPHELWGTFEDASAYHTAHPTDKNAKALMAIWMGRREELAKAG